jgi:hypothetical protein
MEQKKIQFPRHEERRKETQSHKAFFCADEQEIKKKDTKKWKCCRSNIDSDSY